MTGLQRLLHVISLMTLLCISAKASMFGVANARPKCFASDLISQLRGGDGGSDAPTSRPHLPYTLAIRDSIMIAHSFHNNPNFGPAGGLHGATYTVDVEFASKELHPECNWVIDIGAASEMVADVLQQYNYKNLDEVFGEGVMTTTEFMCKAVFDGVVKKLKEKQLINEGDEKLFGGWIKVTLWESHKAWASFEGPAS
mmetsp:Transcript_12006/g.18416  ORF Transcript_12006/g.18416 Transcript_12006/m.18416 type:complete len:198 (+) Transcript_12006:102-695(+)|eukprot:CAMPEP_0201730950 /NCGR_PEP_ID=MMETSP0593-20130828/24126_1 /ASSEMBLY_ACC=CAM_ASM_000672 /TAXON_ID=267983 /ORGANISM="Skeletonema japonicum, Strain CCMP2506" /LENGTH=197 /DNA_ID=CAMNT_0048223621 /DNA_START=32 /DNA_END=625 /DNA_ORIENTATION=-